jgi:hypothetical protein
MTRIEDCPKVYQELKRHVDCLRELLDAPEPGLWSWTNFVAQKVRDIAELYGTPVEWGNFKP